MELTRARERRWLLLDKSALVRGADIDGAYGEPCLCAITRLEMLYSARSARAYKELTTYLNDALFLAPTFLLGPQVRWAEVDADAFDVTLRDAGRTVSGPGVHR